MEILRELVEPADVVQHNMRYDAAVRLGVDYESLQADQARPRSTATRAASSTAHARASPATTRPAPRSPGPTGSTAASTTTACRSGPSSSLGDTGNGFLSAIAIVQALYHRDRTGEGQFVDTSIMYAQLLNASIAWSLADGSAPRRPPAARRDAARLARAATASTRPPTGGCASPRSTTSTRARARRDGPRRRRVRDPTRAHDARSTRSRRRSATRTAARLVRGARRRRRAVRDLDPRLRARPLRRPRDDRRGAGSRRTSIPSSGDMDVSSGLLFDLSETPGVVQGPPLVAGQDTPRDPRRARLRRRRSIDKLAAAGRARLDRAEGPDERALTCPAVIPPLTRPATTSSSGTASPTGGCSSSAARLRRGAPPAGADVRRVPLARVGHRSRVDRARARLHLDRVAPPDRARRRTARRRPRRARRGHPLRRRTCSASIADAVANDMEVDLCIETVDDVVLPQFRPVASVSERPRAGIPASSERGPSGPTRSVEAGTSVPTRPRSSGSARPSSPRTRAAASSSSRARRSLAAVDDAGLTPADIDGMVTFAIDANDELAAHPLRSASPSCASPAGTPRRWRRRVRDGAAGGGRGRVGRGATPCVVYRAFNERSGQRFGQPCAERRSWRDAAPGWNWYLPVRPRHAGQDVRALVPALHVRVRRHQRGLRPLRGGRPQARGDQPRGVVLRAPDHARGPPGSRAGSSSRSCASSTAARRATAASRSWSRAWSARRDLPQPPVRIVAATPGAPRATATRCSTTTTATAPTFPEARVRSAGSSTRRPGSRPTTSTSR